MSNLHSKILIEENFIPNDVCNFLVEFTKNKQYVDLSVFDPEKTNENLLSNKQEPAWSVVKETRDTQTVDVAEIKDLLQHILRRAVFEHVNPFFDVKTDSSEAPQMLRYGPGGHYKPHVDAESLFNNNGIVEWRRSVDRDISFIFYLNDDYEGGELVFPSLNLSIIPKKGMFVAFPSSHHFLHGVKPVISGERFAIVTWATITKS